ncbi:MAG: class I SAM-dependent methyltransferase [Acidobacteria bacterium]|nr:class I SAM-dependent methyltransferase [Acidobacteriota bacterium]
MRHLTHEGPGLVRVGTDVFSYAVPPPRENKYGTPPVYKSKALIEQLDDLLAQIEPRRIVELGIFRGGGVALMAAITQPEKLVAIELNAEREAVLDNYLSRAQLRETVVPYYGVDQGDPEVAEILDVEFGPDAQLDLVIDDASHLYEPSRRSFDMIFPRLRPGGVYVIEDWAAQHTLLATIVDHVVNRRDDWKKHAESIATVIDEGNPDLARMLRDEPDEATVGRAARAAAAASDVDRALSRLGLEIVHVVAETSDVVREVTFTQGWIEITRGEGAVSGPGWLDHGSANLFGSLSE